MWSPISAYLVSAMAVAALLSTAVDALPSPPRHHIAVQASGRDGVYEEPISFTPSSTDAAEAFDSLFATYTMAFEELATATSAPSEYELALTATAASYDNDYGLVYPSHHDYDSDDAAAADIPTGKDVPTSVSLQDILGLVAVAEAAQQAMAWVGFLDAISTIVSSLPAPVVEEEEEGLIVGQSLSRPVNSTSEHVFLSNENYASSDFDMDASTSSIDYAIMA